MSSCGPEADVPLSADELRALTVLMAVSDRPAGMAEIAAQLARLEAPGFAAGSEAVEAAVARLEADGDLSRSDDGALSITEAGRARAWELGGRAPGSPCDSARVCLLLRLCLDGVMPPANRSLLVRTLLTGGDVEGADPARLPN
jgi:hypothetical protein